MMPVKMGHDHESDSSKVGAALMSETLPPGLRRLIGVSELDVPFADWD